MKGKVKKSSPRRQNGTPNKPSPKTTPAPVAGKPTPTPTQQNVVDLNKNQMIEDKTELNLASKKNEITPMEKPLPVTEPSTNLNGNVDFLPDKDSNKYIEEPRQGNVTEGSVKIQSQSQIPPLDNINARSLPQSDLYNNNSLQQQNKQDWADSSLQHTPQGPLYPSKPATDIYPLQKEQAPLPPSSKPEYQPSPQPVSQTQYGQSVPPSDKPHNLNITSHHHPQSHPPPASPAHRTQHSRGSSPSYPDPNNQNAHMNHLNTERRTSFQHDQYNQRIYDEEYNQQPDSLYNNSPHQPQSRRRSSLVPDDIPGQHRHCSPSYGSPVSSHSSGSYPRNDNEFYQMGNLQKAASVGHCPPVLQTNQGAMPSHSPGGHRSRSRTRRGSLSPTNVIHEAHVTEYVEYEEDMPPEGNQGHLSQYYNMQGQHNSQNYNDDYSGNIKNSPSNIPSHLQMPRSPRQQRKYSSPTNNIYESPHGMPPPENSQLPLNRQNRRSPSPQMGVKQSLSANRSSQSQHMTGTNYNGQRTPRDSNYPPDEYNQYGSVRNDNYPAHVPQMGTQQLYGPNNGPNQQGSYMDTYPAPYNTQERRENFRRNSYSTSSQRGRTQGQYNPENVDTSFQVTTPLKHIDNSTPIKRAPRSPKSPLALPLGVRQPPSPSTVARALKVDMREDIPSVSPATAKLPPIPKKEIFVTFPDKQIIKQFVDPNMAMMDLLVQLAASKRLNPSAHVLLATSEIDNGPVDYKANQPIGLVESHRVSLLPKEQYRTTSNMLGQDNNMDRPLPFEDINLPPGQISPAKVYDIYQPGPNLISPDQMTYRLTINLPHAQKVVRRMSANHPLHELHQSVCEEKNLDPNVFVLQRPDKPGAMINLKYTLQELGLQQYELNLVHKSNADHYMSVPNLSETSWINNDPTQRKQSQGPTKNYIHMPPPGESRKKKGFFGFLRKDKKDKSRSLSPNSFSELADTIENWMTSLLSGNLLNHSNSSKQRPASMFSPVTESLENYMKKPKKSTKKKPAPPPPTTASTMPPGGVKPNQSYMSSTLPRPASSSYPSGMPQYPGPMMGEGSQPVIAHGRSNSESRAHIEPNIPGYPSSQPPLPIPAHMKQHHQQPPQFPPPRPPTDSPVYKIGTDSITYMEGTPNKGPAGLQPANVAEIHAAAPVRNGDSVTNISPNTLQQKTANDMYASPYKKRKPAPPPPPGGPQVSPSSTSIHRTTSSLCSSMTNSLDYSTPYYSSSTSSMEPQSPTQDVCKTPLITIKTGSASNESSSPSNFQKPVMENEGKEDVCDFTDDKFAPVNACTSVFKDTDEMMHLTDASSTLTATDLSNSLEELSKIQRPCSFVAPPPPLTPPPSEPPSSIPSPITVMEYDRVDKSVGVAEDSLSLAASDIPSQLNGHSDNLSRNGTITVTTSTSTSNPDIECPDTTPPQMNDAPTKGNDQTFSDASPTPVINGTIVSKAEELNPEMELFIEHSSNITSADAPNFRPSTPVQRGKDSNGRMSPDPHMASLGNELTEGTAIYLGRHRNSLASGTDDDFSTTETVTSNISMGDAPTPQKTLTVEYQRRPSISSEGSFTTIGMSDDYNINGTHDQLPNGDALPEEMHMVPGIVENTEPKIPYDVEAYVSNNIDTNMVGHNQINGIEDEIIVSASCDNTSRPMLESSPSLELSRSSSAAELAHYMNSPKDELVLTKEDRKSLDYRGSPMIDNQKKLEKKEDNKKLSPGRISPKIKLDGYTLSIDSESDTIDSTSTHEDSIPLSAQTNLKKQIERWQKQLQEHLNDNSGLYTAQEQDKLRENVDKWNKQLKELNVRDSSGFRLLEQKVMKQQIELWQRKLSAKERQSDGAKKYEEREVEFLKKQVQVWKQKINIIEKSSNLYTIEEREVLQEQIDLWQSQLDKKCSDIDTSTKEQSLLRRQIEVWKKNLKDKKFAGHSFSSQEQDILRRQLLVWQKQLQWYKVRDLISQREILKEQVNVWHSQLQDVQKHQDKDSKMEQEILEQQIELWQNKMNKKNPSSEAMVMKQIDIWKKQTQDNKRTDNGFLTIEQKLLDREIQLWNKKLDGEDIESEVFVAAEMDVLCDKIDLYQQRLQDKDPDSALEPIEQDLLKLQVDLWQQKLAAMQERRESLKKYNEEQQNILKFQIELWQDRLAQQNTDTGRKITELKGSELLAKEIDIWQRWLDVKREKKETRIKFKLLDEELQKDQIRLWQDHLGIIKNNTLGYTEEEREILMQQIELWQKGLVENKDKKIIHLAVEQDILKKYIDLWYTKMKRNTDSYVGEEESEVREQIAIWKKQLKLFTLEEAPLPHSVQQDIINQQIVVWQKKRAKCQTQQDSDELGKIESEILQQQIELWQNDLMDYEKNQNIKENVPQKQIKLLQRKLSKTDKDVNPEITAQENAIVNRQIDFYTKMSSLDEGYNAEYIADEQEILEKQIDLARLKLSQTDASSYYSETEHDLLRKQVNLWHRQLVAIQHRLDIRRKLAVQEQNLLKEQIYLWETKLKNTHNSAYASEEQKAMKDQLEIWQQQLAEHKSSILNKSSSVKGDPLTDKMAQMLKSQEEIIQSFQQGLKHLPENLKNPVRSPPTSPKPKGLPSKNIPSVLPPPPPELPKKPTSPKEIKSKINHSTHFPPPPEIFSDKSQKQKENAKTKNTPSPVSEVTADPPSPPSKLPFTVNLKKVGPPKENSPPVKTEVNFFRKQDDQEGGGVVRAVPAMVVLKPPSVAPKPKRRLPEPELTPREKLLLEIKNSSRSNLKGNTTYADGS
ncbi:uncharacterized protein LOC115210393 isoform X1 [Argonauta hians]